jgi:hypothetical protein
MLLLDKLPSPPYIEALSTFYWQGQSVLFQVRVSTRHTLAAVPRWEPETVEHTLGA